MSNLLVFNFTHLSQVSHTSIHLPLRPSSVQRRSALTFWVLLYLQLHRLLTNSTCTPGLSMYRMHFCATLFTNRVQIWLYRLRRQRRQQALRCCPRKAMDFRLLSCDFYCSVIGENLLYPIHRDLRGLIAAWKASSALLQICRGMHFSNIPLFPQFNLMIILQYRWPFYHKLPMHLLLLKNSQRLPVKFHFWCKTLAVCPSLLRPSTLPSVYML
jgi:hypothetical protein